MNLFERLKTERERLGYNQTAFASFADASKHAQINWEKGLAAPNANALAAWANVGLDVLYVVTGSRSFVPPPRLSGEEQTLLDYYQEASREARKAALRALLSAAPAASSSGGIRQTNVGAPNIQIGGHVGGTVNITRRGKSI